MSCVRLGFMENLFTTCLARTVRKPFGSHVCAGLTRFLLNSHTQLLFFSAVRTCGHPGVNKSDSVYSV